MVYQSILICQIMILCIYRGAFFGYSCNLSLLIGYRSCGAQSPSRVLVTIVQAGSLSPWSKQGSCHPKYNTDKTLRHTCVSPSQGFASLFIFYEARTLLGHCPPPLRLHHPPLKIKMLLIQFKLCECNSGQTHTLPL